MIFAKHSGKKANILAYGAIGATVLLLASVAAQAQNEVSTSAELSGVEVTDTMTVTTGDVVATVEADNMDFWDVNSVGAEAILYAGSSPTGSPGPVSWGLTSALSSTYASSTAGQSFTVFGYAALCYGAGDGDDDDDDDDDDDGLGLGGSYLLGNGPSEAGETCMDVGYIPLTLQAGVPSIQSISKSSDTIGSSGSFTVQGENLIDTFGVSNVAMTGGVTTSIAAGESATTATINYSIPDGASGAGQSFTSGSGSSSATAGTQYLTISNSFGTSNQEAFQVVDPSPTVTGVMPAVWYAGNAYTITITGTNFGTGPSVSIQGPSGPIPATTTCATGSCTDATVTATINVPANSASGAATVTVTSTGFSGSGFYPGSSGNSPSGSNSALANVQAVTPAPQIMIIPSVSQAADTANLASCTGGTQGQTGNNQTDVYAGQKMLLCALPPPGFTIVSATWSFDDPADITGGFVNGAGDAGTQPSAAAGGSEALDPALMQSNPASTGIPFYFVNPGTTETATLQWTLSNGDPNGNTSTADFNIQGPTGDLLITPDMIQGKGANDTGVVVNATAGLSTTGVIDATGNNLVGITFTGDATPPSGTNQYLTWVQLLNNHQVQVISNVGSKFITNATTTAIDSSYPYTRELANYTSDTPANALPDTYGELWESFTATMYLMWDPGLPSGCTPAKTTQTMQDGYPVFTSTPSNCTSTPFPLSSVQWHWSGCAINTLANQTNNTTWSLSTVNGCPVQILGTSQSAGFPEWPAQ